MNRVVNQRYTLLRTLGEGGMGEVFLAADRERPGSLVALKYLARRGAGTADTDRLREEFRRMARLTHPHLVQVYDLETDRGRGEPFIAMEYVEGVDFRIACHDAPLPVVLELASQTCLALEYLHAQGVVHCDLKPENILVSPAAEAGGPPRVRLLDFGLAAALDQGGWEARGSLSYAAPEQFRGEWVDHRADLYALGVVLYESLTGRLPFAAAAPAELIQAHLTEEPPPPSRWRPGLDPAVEAIILRLLRKRPAERYQSARQVVEAIRLLAAGPDISPARITTPRIPRLVGREEPLAGLERLIGALVGIEPPLGPLRLLLQGPAGSGKSRLAEEARARARSRGVEVAQVGVAGSAAAPFALLLQLHAALDAVGRRLQVTAHSGEPTQDNGPATEKDTPPAAPEVRLREAVRRLAEVSPLLIILEDLHAADADSLRALADFVRGEERLRLGILATAREPLARLSPELAAEWEGEEMGRQEILPPLRDVEISRLLASLLGADPSNSAPQALLERSAGNPRFAVEWALALVERGLLEVRDGVWRLDPAAGALAAPPGLVELSRLRLEGLSAPAVTLASALAVFDRPVSPAAAAAVSGLDEPTLLAAARELGANGVLSGDTVAGAPLELAHAALRDALLRRDTDGLPRLHARAAAWLETEGSATAAETALHWREAGEPARLVPHAVRGAEEAAAAGARVQAIQLLEWALEATPHERAGGRVELLRRLLQVDLGVQDWERRRSIFLRLEREAQLAADEPALLEVAVGLYTCAVYLQEWEEAERLEARCQELLRSTAHAEPLTAAKFVRTQAHRAAHLGDADRAVQLSRTASEAYRGAGRNREAALSLNNAGLYLLGVRPPELAEPLFHEADALLRAAGDDLWGFLPRLNLGVVSLRQGKWAEAAGRFETEMEALRQHGQSLWIPQVFVDLALARERDGRIDRALQDYEEAAEMAARYGLVQVRLHALERQGSLLRRLGLHERAIQVHAQALAAAHRRRLPGQVAFLAAALAQDRADAGDAAAAAALAEEASREAEALGHARARLRAALATASAALAGGSATAAAAALEKARPFADPAHQHPECSQIALLAARAALAGNDRAGAAAALADALHHARLGSLAAEEAEALALGIDAGLGAEPEEDLRRLGQILHTISGRISDPAVARLVRSGPAWRAVAREATERAGLTGDETASLPERMALRVLTEIGRTIETLDDPRRLAGSLLEQARTLVGAERALLVLTDADGSNARAAAASDLPAEAEQEALDFSRAALARGLEAPLLVLDASRDPRFASSLSVERFGIRSIVCAPLRLRGVLLGAVYLDSRTRVLNAGPDHLRFVEAFAHQAAAALDSARALEGLRSERERLRGRARERYRFHALLGRSPAMQEIYDLLEPFSKSDLPVLITGESGTGKELVARALHWNGPRRDGPFVAENCAAIPESLLESEMFGHLRGAFTGAERDRRGLFEEASGGTLLLDEIGEMGAAPQAKLLRVLQEGEVRPLGAARPVRVDVRIVAATQRDLPAAVRQGSFREDLLYRLRVLTLTLPALRERLEDLPLLARHFLEEHRREYGRGPADVSAEVIERLSRYPWPGNVRELRSEIQKMALVAEGTRVELRDLEAHPELFGALLHPGRAPARSRAGTLRDLERQQVEHALQAAQGDKQKAAEMLGLSRATLYRKLRRYRIAPPART
jgi:transcriptional regulator with GAF, ATPase, and Fis domain